MSNDSSAIVSKVWNYAHVLKNAGVGYGDYVEQITYLLFLKLAPPSLKLRRAGSEMTELGFDPPSPRLRRAGNPIPAKFGWAVLSRKSGNDLATGTTAIDHLEAEPDRQINRSNRLRQSALAAAFCGS